MSADEGAGGATTPGREVAQRLFAAEFDDATYSYAESDEERAPTYVVSPTGARLNRVFVVGTLTEVTDVNEEMVRARVADPTGAFVVYAGQYQPEALAFLEDAEPPAHVAVTGKARTFEPEDGDRIFSSIRPETLATVDAETFDRWVVDTADATVERIETSAVAAASDVRGDALRAALADRGVPEAVAAGVPLALAEYGTTSGYLAALRERAIDATRVVAGEADQVTPFDRAPDDERTDERSTFAALASGSALPADGLAATAADGASSDGPVGGGGDADVEAATDGETTDAEPETDGETADAGPGAEGRTAGAGPATDGQTPETKSTDGDVGGPGADVDAATAAPVDEAGSDDRYEFDDDERAEIEETYGTEFTTGSEVDEPGAADIDVAGSEVDGPTADETTPPDGTDTPDESAVGRTDATAVAESGSSADADASDDVEAEDDGGADGDEAAEVADVGAGDAAEPADVEPVEGEDEGRAADGDAVDDVEAGADDEVDADAEDETEAAGAAVPAGEALQDAAVDAMVDLDDGDGASYDAVVEATTAETGASAEAVADAIQDALMGGRCYEPEDGTLKPI